MKKIIVLLVVLLLCFATSGWSFFYQYMTAGEVRKKLQAGSSLALVDIQVEEEFASHHLQGALASYAYPVKSAADQQKLHTLLSQLQTSSEPVVIICPRGGGGAKRAYDYLQDQGIAEDRLYILEKGQQGWPYADLLAQI